MSGQKIVSNEYDKALEIRFALHGHVVAFVCCLYIGDSQQIQLIAEIAGHRIWPDPALGNGVGSSQHGKDGQSEFDGKGKIAFIMCWNCHDCPGSIRHQHVVGNPDRHLLAIDGIDGESASEHARFVTVRSQSINFAGTSGHVSISCDGFSLAFYSEFIHERMLRCQDHEGGSPQCVWTCGEHGNRIVVLCGEDDFCALGSADPVLLHFDDVVRPLLQRVEIIEQLLSILGDLEEPLLQGSWLWRCATAFALATDDLLVGQHGVACRAIIDRGFLLVGQSCFVQLDEQPLCPFVVVGQTGGDLAIPIELHAPVSELLFRCLDVLLGEGPRMCFVFDGCILGRKAKGVPSHGVQDL